jgi:hypothetical protein
MRTLRKLENNVGANFDNIRFKTKLIDSFPKLWNAICSICYSMTSLSEIIVILTSHKKWILQMKTLSTSSTGLVKALEASILALQAKIKML